MAGDRAQSMAQMSAINSVSSGIIRRAPLLRASASRGLATGRNPAFELGLCGCQEALRVAPAGDRSGAAGDAVRDRAFDCSCRRSEPWPVGAGAGLTRRARLCASSRLTPARWQAKRLASQSRGPNGAGSAVPDGTAVEPRWNHQPIDNAAFSARFQRFRALASRVMRACMRVDARVYARGSFAGTLELYDNLIRYQVVSGSKCGSKRFHSGTVALARLTRRRKARKIYKLAGGYSPLAGCAIVLVACSTVQLGRAGETFGPGARWAVDGRRDWGGAGREAGARGGSARCGGNGGFLRVSGGRSGHVGTAMLEGVAEGRGNACFSGAGHQPVRLARRASGEGHRGSRSAGGTPLAPIATDALPSTLARDRGRILIGTGMSDLGLGGIAARRQRLIGMVGSGWKYARSQPALGTAGRGACGALWENRVDVVHGKAGAAHVN